MSDNDVPTKDIPEWFLQTMRVMQDTDHGLRNIETELRHAMELENLDPVLRDEMQYVRDALGAVKVSLSVVDMTARRVLNELAKADSRDHRVDAGG